MRSEASSQQRFNIAHSFLVGQDVNYFFVETASPQRQLSEWCSPGPVVNLRIMA